TSRNLFALPSAPEWHGADSGEPHDRYLAMRLDLKRRDSFPSTNIMSGILMVPIHLDALRLKSETTVIEAMADFSRLPYNDGARDANSEIANISEEIVSKPFQSDNLRLKPGTHLHWALPDALTSGIQTANGTDFPAAPNRWLITRRVEQEGRYVVDGQWV